MQHGNENLLGAKN